MTLDVLEINNIILEIQKVLETTLFWKIKNTRTITFWDTKNDNPSNKSGWKDYIEKV